jgi:hypothetical protein
MCDDEDIEWMMPIYLAKEEAWNNAREAEALAAEQAARDAADAAEMAWFGLGDRVVASFNRKYDLLEAGDLTAFKATPFEDEDSADFWADFMEAHGLFEDEETVEALERMKNLEQRTKRHFEVLEEQRQAAKRSALTVPREQGKGFGVRSAGGSRKDRK